MHRGVEAVAVLIDTRRDLIATPIIHKGPLDGMKHVLTVARSAQAFGDGAEIPYEELLKVSETSFVVFAVPTLFSDLYADFFGIAIESFNRTEVASVQLPPFSPKRAKNPSCCSNEMLMCGSHYALVYTSCLLCL